MPRKISAENALFRSIAPVLSAFFSFLEEKAILKNGSNLATTVNGLDEQIIENASNSKNWGFAKSFTMAAKNAGFDITDEKEMQLFNLIYNMHQLAKLKNDNKNTYKSKNNIGRNAPCPCGSGKKYKKCCGHPNKLKNLFI